MSHLPPIAGTDTWLAVMARYGSRCGCKGNCGQLHKASGGHCDATNEQIGKPPLIAAPVDASLGLRKLIPPASTPLMAWCLPCFNKALTKARRATKDQPTLYVPLFDLPARQSA